MDTTDAPERVALCVGLPFGPEAPVLARRSVADTLGERVPRQTLEDVLLVVSELVANSVRHGRGGVGPGVSLALHVERQRIRVEALDGGAAPRAARHGGIGGWGLSLVDRLADRWGFVPGRPTVAWAEFDLVSSRRDPTRDPDARTARRVR